MLTLAHPGQPPAPHDAWLAWDLDPWILIGVVAAWVLYRRGSRPSEEMSRQRSVFFGGGLLAVLIAVASPLDAIGTALASAHMIQHLLLMLVAAPLLVLGRPGETMLRGAPYSVRKGFGRTRRFLGLTPSRVRTLAHPLVIWLAYAAVLWLWHLPGPYGAALESDLIHSVEHVSFLAVAVLFWSLTLVGLEASRGLAVLGVFTAALQSTILAALLTFATTPWYSAYLGTTTAWGISALDDQQIAGVIMWVPGGLLYLAAALTLFAFWVRDSEPEAQLLHRRSGG